MADTRVFRNVKGAPVKLGADVIVRPDHLGIVGDYYAGQEGITVFLNYCGTLKNFPHNPVIGVWFPDLDEVALFYIDDMKIISEVA